MHRREVLKLLGAAGACGLAPYHVVKAAGGDDLYKLDKFGNVRLLHMTDTHAQLTPVHFREPNVNLGIGAMKGRPPHLVGKAFLDYFGIKPETRPAHAFTSLDFVKQAKEYGRIGGFAHLKTLIEQLRAEVGPGKSLLVDGGDLVQGTGLADATKGSALIEAANLLGIEAMTGHWEFTFGEDRLLELIKLFKGDFVAQNVYLTEEAAFNDKPAFDSATGRVFKPATVKEVAGFKVGLIGQAFPYVPIAHPKRFTPDWTFGIRDAELQKLVDDLREKQRVDAVVLLSHNGMDVDLKLASRVSGIDLIMGGHTHDAVPQPISVKNHGGNTLVTNAGSSGKFLAVIDMELSKGAVKDLRYHLLPVYPDLLKPDLDMQALIDRVSKPTASAYSEKLAVAGDLLYRRDNFNGPIDQVICDGLRNELDAELAFSPGFRWGNTMLPGEPITMEDVLSETAITYPEVYVQEMTGAQIKSIMEDICDNLFNPDPYYQQGGDMVRIGGMNYSCAPGEVMGKRISDLTLDSGKPLEAGKTYKVAGWASVNPQTGKPAAEAFAKFLREQKIAQPRKLNRVRLKGVDGNPGVAG